MARHNDNDILVFPDTFGELYVAVVVASIRLVLVGTGTIADNHHAVTRFRHLARLDVLILLDLRVEHDRFLMLVGLPQLYTVQSFKKRNACRFWSIGQRRSFAYRAER